MGDLYEREKRGNLYGGKCLVALFTMTGWAPGPGPPFPSAGGMGATRRGGGG